MTSKAQQIADAVTHTPRSFWVPKASVGGHLAAIRRIGQREDISGKFARRLAVFARPLLAAQESIEDEGRALQKAAAVRTADGKLQEQWDNNPDGTPRWVYDARGDATDERLTKPDTWVARDPEQFQADVLELNRELVEIRVSPFTDADFHSFEKIAPSIVIALYDFHIDNAETQKAPLSLVEGEDDDGTGESERAERTAP